ncbi:hypothetical protein Tco_0464981 [Tanacetum coccineum]
MVVCIIGKPRGIIITMKSNHPKCLERKCFRNFLFLELTLMGIFKSRKVVGGEIFCSFLSRLTDIKVLEQENPPVAIGLRSVSKQCIGGSVGLSCPRTAPKQIHLIRHDFSKGSPIERQLELEPGLTSS